MKVEFSLTDEDVERLADQIAGKISKALKAELAKHAQTTPAVPDKRLQLSRVETAKQLGCSESTIDNLVKRGLLHPNRATRRPMFTMKELDRFLAEGSQIID